MSSPFLSMSKPGLPDSAAPIAKNISGRVLVPGHTLAELQWWEKMP
ncbi:hypothetical protein [Ottowia thiooxydans]|nr:hypothetical protein [Ottowia thiooxydans]